MLRTIFIYLVFFRLYDDNFFIFICYIANCNKYMKDINEYEKLSNIRES